ncbi:amino acid adenylation domain-containing protein [Actinoalloteichus hymeniacidonis]|uniref:Amino acid adenylation enzyme/thioester reductase family protein n=1 Tax=Actinoalloteichus hymeniacidonis TaxID=340345 RepID=A0AAC9MZ06_9PSEU|nr:non-ribosomal peptide synthetase [Actinoalloteichus hymeniacidonis]AOS63974.1 amino acid adenylation enzyme/thioester reductase family protein [Actinoalloteichus hymeniacidonis]MBB5907968.1 amino acid adenylation domain-containing protein [Actinoalloteichus hymeniacidonis]
MRRLSSGQQRMWLLQQVNPASSAYNVRLALRFSDGVDLPVLRRVLDAVLTRHAVLRSVFQTGGDGNPISTTVGSFSIPLIEVTAQQGWRKAVAPLADAPFDLLEAPAARGLVASHPDGSAVLCLVFHHIIMDGRSLAILAREIPALYEAELRGDRAVLPAARASYEDYVDQQASNGGTDTLEAQLAFWRGELDGAEQLDLLLDFPRLPGGNAAGATSEFTLSEATTSELRAIARRWRCTMSSAATALFQATLALYTGQDEITIGTVLHGRQNPEFSDVIGLFVNTVVLRGEVVPSTPFRQLLRTTHATLNRAYAHQDVQFEQVVAALQPDRQGGRNPLFDVLFLYQGEQTADHDEASGIERLPWLDDSTRFDLELRAEVVDDRLTGAFIYRSDLFRATTIERLGELFVRIAELIVADPDGSLEYSILLDEVERDAGAGRFTGLDTEATLGARFERQARRTPDAVAVSDGGSLLGYGDLDALSNQLTHLLLARGVGAGSVVAVVAPPGRDLLLALLATAKVGAVCLPLPPDDAGVLLAACGVRTVLVASGVDPTNLSEVDVDLVVIPASSSAAAGFPITPPPACSDAGQPAVALPVDGQDGRPEIITMSHAELGHLATAGDGVAGSGPRTLLHSVSGSGLIEIWSALLDGGRVVVAPLGPLTTTVLRELATAERLSRVRLDGRLFHVLAEDDPEVFLGIAEVWTDGAGVASPMVERVLLRSPGTHVVLCYGAPGYEVTRRITSPYETIAGRRVGRLRHRSRSYVVGPGSTMLPSGVPGELCLAVDGGAAGQPLPSDTQAAGFVADPWGPPDSRLRRTGQLVRRLPDGDLEFLGRVTDGRRIHGSQVQAWEVERILGAHPNLERVVVAPHEDDDGGGNRLICFACGRPGARLEAEEIRRFAVELLPPQLVPADFLVLDSMPLDASGLVRTADLPFPRRTSTTGRQPRNLREEVLCALFSDVLGVHVTSVDDDFFVLGGHSFLVARLVGRVRTELAAELSIRTVFENPTVARLAVLIEQASTPRQPLTAAPRPTYPPLSHPQRRLWFLFRATGADANYNVPIALRLVGRLDRKALIEALDDVVERHEALRTVFPSHEGNPYQRVVADARITMEHRRVSEPKIQAALDGAAAHLFDLTRDIPIKAWLFETAEDDHTLLLVIHHIACDGVSLEPFGKDLAHAFRARIDGRRPDWTPLPVQYVDYSRWQSEQLGDPDDSDSLAAKQGAYWRDHLAGLPAEVMPMPDRPRSARAGTAGARIDFEIAPPLHARLRDLAIRHRVSVNMVLRAGLAVLMSKFGCGRDIPIGGVTAGRTDEALNDLVGFFVNTQVLRYDLSGEPTFTELLSRIREVDLAAHDHQDLDFEQVVELTAPSRTLSHHPLFQVMLVFQSYDEGRFELDGLSVERRNITVETTKFDLRFMFTEKPEGGGVHGALGYATGLFDPDTTQRMVDGLVLVLDRLSADPEQPVDAVDALDDHGRAELRRWNRTEVEVPDVTLTELLDRQTSSSPDAVAVVDAAEQVTYAELDRRSRRLARRLRARGADVERIVAVSLPRSVDLVVAIIAVLRSGAAYLPLEPELPELRRTAMLADAEPVVLLDQALFDELTQSPGPAAETETEIEPRQPAYLLYTSGSTGRPKGVLMEHRAIVNRLLWGKHAFPLRPEDRVLQKTPAGFDVSVWEFFWPLIDGATLVMAAPDGHRDPRYLAGIIREQRITSVHFVPSMLEVFLSELDDDSSLPTLRRVFCGGEALSPSLVQRYSRSLSAPLINFYGPTETAVEVTSWHCPASGPLTTVPIGTPLWNTRAHVLDAALRPVPVGVPGELYIAGAQLARGYFRQPALTAERFIADPFGPAGSRMYRTGDLARWRADGTLEYLGRVDDQVKLRGVRIELDEIGAAVASHPAVEQAAAAVYEPEPGMQRIVAYVVPVTTRSPLPEHDRDDRWFDSESLTRALRDHVGRTLIPAMVPSDLVYLDRLPVTQSGKLDRRSLPVPTRSAASAPRAPGTLPEARLAELVARTLKISSVGIEDNFFQLGGHSLLAAQLTGLIRESLGVEVPVSAVFQAPSVAELSKLIGLGDVPERFDVMLPIRPAGNGIPVFFVHPGIGLSWCYFPFSRYLSGRPLYAIQARAVTDAEPGVSTLGEMADDYLEQIRRVQPHGPYRLVGWSFGGNVAHAMSASLAAAGEEVELLAMIDAYPYLGSQPENALPEPEEIEPRHIELVRRSFPQLHTEAILDQDRLEFLAKALTRHHWLGTRHRPGLHQGDILYFRASGHPDEKRLSAESWAEFVTGEVRTIQMDVGHFELLDADPLSRIAEVLGEELSRPK